MLCHEDSKLARRLKVLELLLVAGVLSLFLDCNPVEVYEHVHYQLPTFADMLNICKEIEELPRTGNGIPGDLVAAVIARYRGGHDRWGSPFLFRQRTEPSPSYLLISLGSDRKLDVADINQYYDWQRDYIVGRSSRDIVFRDGSAVTIASDK